METAIYVRVSTEEQAQEGFSIRAQEQKLKDFTRIKDWSIYNIYIDEGISAKNITERPAVTKMIEDIKSGHVKNVVVFKIDRLTRSTGDLVYLIDLFNDYDCAFNSLMESIDTQTASGRMFLKIIGIFAEFERENIAERVRLGHERKAREGYSLCSLHSSYGYDRANGQKIQTINKKEAEIVKQIFDWYVNQNMSLMGIAKRLNLMKVATKHNCLWTNNTVKLVLINCNYIGKVRYHINKEESSFEVDGHHEAIISQKIYDKAQKLIAKNKGVSSTKKPRDENYYLGFLHCPLCGSKLRTHGSYDKLVDGTTSYRASYRCRNTLYSNCNFSNISHRNLENAFIDYVKKIADLEEIEGLKLEEQQNNAQKTKELIQAYNEKLSGLDLREKEVLSLYVDGNVTFERYRDIKDKIDKGKKEIHAELEKLTAIEENPAEFTKEDFVLAFKDNWEHLTNVEKRQFLLTFVKQIHVSTEKVKNKRRWIVSVTDVEFA